MDAAAYRMCFDEDKLAILCAQYDRRLDSIGTENAKLRELVRAAWKCIHSGLSCSDCRLTSGGCTLQSAMRELGVARHGD